MTIDQHRRVKAIPTRYDGYLFRSRLEARWAKFFKALDIKYLYEDQGFDIDGHAYLPDFAIFLLRTIWGEVKPAIGADPDGESRFRAFIASQPIGTKGVLLTAMIGDEPGDCMVIGSQGDGGYWETEHPWAMCSAGQHLDLRWDMNPCEGCAAPCNPEYGPDAPRWDYPHPRVTAAYLAARSERFGR